MAIVLHGLESQDMTFRLYFSEFELDVRVPVFENNMTGGGRRNLSFNPAYNRG